MNIKVKRFPSHRVVSVRLAWNNYGMLLHTAGILLAGDLACRKLASMCKLQLVGFFKNVS